MFSLITVVVWIGLQVFFTLTTKQISPDYQKYMDPVEPTLNTAVLEEITDRNDEFMPMDQSSLE